MKARLDALVVLFFQSSISSKVFPQKYQKNKIVYPEAAIENLSRANVFRKMLFCTVGRNHGKVPTRRSLCLINIARFEKRTLSMVCFKVFEHICRVTIL